MSDEVLSMDAAALEEDLAMLAGSPHNSGSWDSATLARAGQGKTLWIGEYHLVFGLNLSNSVLKCKTNCPKMEDPENLRRFIIVPMLSTVKMIMMMMVTMVMMVTTMMMVTMGTTILMVTMM